MPAPHGLSDSRRGSNPLLTEPSPERPAGLLPIVESVGFLSQNHLSRPGTPSTVVKRQPLAG